MANAPTPATGTVTACWRYPVKSLQGLSVDRLEIGPSSIEGDRAHGIVDVATGKVLSAKRTKQLLDGIADDSTITLPDGTSLGLDDPSVDASLSQWLGRTVRLVSAPDAGAVSYEMTFDPPNEDAEVYDIPVPEGTLLDLSPVHLVTTATLAHCEAARPDLDWDLRRFRPNLVLDVDVPPFGEQAWVDHEITIGGATLSTIMPMLRCAMPLRAQPGLGKEPAIFQALTDLNEAFPNHLGLACGVIHPGSIRVGDPVSVA